MGRPIAEASRLRMPPPGGRQPTAGEAPKKPCDSSPKSTVASESEAQSLDLAPSTIQFEIEQDEEDDWMYGAHPRAFLEVATAAVASGANGLNLAEASLRRAVSPVAAADELTRTLEKMELKVATYYDTRFGLVFNFLYDVLHLSSGRDKFLAVLQGYAEFASAALAIGEGGVGRQRMYRAMQESLSDGRKIFRLFKEFREVYKVRRGFHRMLEGIAEDGVVSVMATCGFLDICGHCCSFVYYLFDNLLWAASVGLVRIKKPPPFVEESWRGLATNGRTVDAIGGVRALKWWRNFASISRLNFAITANALLLVRAVRSLQRSGDTSFQGPDDPRVFHTLELIGMFASYRILLSKLHMRPMKFHSVLGILAMVAAICGLWPNWRKVVKKKFGSKKFITIKERRQSDNGVTKGRPEAEAKGD